jgi:hypothetical protein
LESCLWPSPRVWTRTTRGISPLGIGCSCCPSYACTFSDQRLPSQRTGFWINGPRCFRSRSGPKLPALSIYSPPPPSRIDGHEHDPAHHSIPGLQIEADAIKTKTAGVDGQQRFARSSRNPSRTCTGTHHSSRQLPRGRPPASWQGSRALLPLSVFNELPDYPAGGGAGPSPKPAGGIRKRIPPGKQEGEYGNFRI